MNGLDVGRWITRCVSLLLPLAMLGNTQGCLSEKGEKQVESPTFRGKDSVEETVGEAGAVILLGSDLRLVIPAGALADDVKLQVGRTSASELSAFIPEDGVASAVVEVKPFDQVFMRAITVELRVTNEDAKKSQLEIVQLERPKDESFLPLTDLSVHDPESGGLDDLPKAEREFLSSRRISGDFGASGIFLVAFFAGNADGGAGDGGGAEGGTDGGVAAEPATLPLDLQAECAQSCTLQFEPLELDGELRRCFPDSVPADFDPTSFDFAAACNVIGQTPSWILHAGDAFVPSDSEGCEVSTAGTSTDGAYASASCADGDIQLSTALRVVEAGGQTFLYDYDDCSGTCAASFTLLRLDPSDTASTAESCLAEANVRDSRCGSEPGEVVISQGVEGVADLPQGVEGDWLLCGSVSGSYVAADLQAACADAGTGATAQFVRFTADGSSDNFVLEGGPDAFALAGGICGGRIGADDTTLFSADGTGSQVRIASSEYERVSEGTDELLVVRGAESNGDHQVYVRATLGDFVAGDPCDTLPMASLVLE